MGPLDGFRMDGPPTPIRYEHPRRPSPRPRTPTSAWVPAGQQADVAGKIIPGGLFFVGQGLLAPSGAIEPALIDPALPLDRDNPDWDGDDLEPWPAYATLTPASRAAYLTWLADGRRHPRAPIGYVFLFFHGLERRVLVDGLQRGELSAELSVIEAEVRRLLDVYGADAAFSGHATEFLDLLSVVRPVPDAMPPAHAVEDRWPVPLTLRAGLGRFAAQGSPVPANWALSWSWYHPAIYPRTPQTRCAKEFRRLFAIRYRERHGDGLVVSPNPTPVRLQYHPASGGLLGIDLDLTDVPDVVGDPDATRDLTALVDAVTDELEAFSRFVGHNPAERESLAAQALLPAELVSDADGPAAPLLSWARAQLGTDASVVIDAADLIRFWPARVMSGADVITCAQLLERHGIGLEPDPRLGGPILSTGPAVLFEARGDMPRAAGPEYAAATTLLQLAVAVGGVDGQVQAVEQEVMLDHLGTALELTAAEQERLAAHLHWLSSTGTKLAGLTDRVAALPPDRREAIGEVLVAVAAADGVIAPEEVEILGRIFEMLGLARETLFSRLHAHSVEIPTVDVPAAEVAGADAPGAGSPVVDRPRHAPPARPAAPPPERPHVPGVVTLDAGVLAASAASTAAVSSLLGDIFADDDPEPEPDDSPSEPDEDADGLDDAHRALLSEVLGRPRWTQAEFADLADRAGLMPAGALDTLNEHALDLCDDVLIETEDDALVLNDFAVEAIAR